MSKPVSNISSMGKFMVLTGILVSVPLLVLPYFTPELGYAWAFLIPSSFSLISGFLLFTLGKFIKGLYDNSSWKLSMQKSSILVLFAWTWGILVGAIPFVLSNQLGLIQSLFESISGWTTTGLSVMDVSVTPRIFLFYRSFMQFCGGLGFVMMMNVFVQEEQSMRLYHAEGHSDKLLPNLRKTSQLILLMYSILLVGGTLSYIFTGMGVFESLMHSMCALSTGGFSTRLWSIGEYNSLGIELVTIVLMLFGTTNFAVLFLIFRFKWKQTVKVSEVRLLFWLLLFGISIFAFGLFQTHQFTGVDSLRVSVFNVVSALSTTGYSSIDFSKIPSVSLGVIILMMLIGGGIGSTAGGIKLERIFISLKVIALHFHTRIHPSRNIHPGYYCKAQGKFMIDDKLIIETTAHVISYLSIIIIGAFALAITSGATFQEALFEFSSAFGTVGLSIGITNPSTNIGTLLVEMLGMVLGRLEIFIVIVAFKSSFELIRTKLG